LPANLRSSIDSLVVAFDDIDQEDEDSLARWRERATLRVATIKSDDELLRVLLAAHFLEIDELYKLCCERVESVLRNSPNAAALRAVFDIEADFDAADELRIAKENSWRPIEPDEQVDLPGLAADWYTGNNAMTLSVYYDKISEQNVPTIERVASTAATATASPQTPTHNTTNDSTASERDSNWDWQDGDGSEQLPEHVIPLVKLRRPTHNSHDDSVERCQGCGDQFTTFYRKHHCRACGM
jgi:hypothetical protein